MTKCLDVPLSSSSCSPAATARVLLPVLHWLPRYNWRQHLASDLSAGLTVAVMHIPQGMAYGLLAGVLPVTGIHTAIFPVLPYVILGNLPHVSMGTFAVVSLLVAGAVPGGETGRVAALTAATGLVQSALGLTRLGSLTALLTDTVVSAFTVGAGLHVLTSQLHHVLGLERPGLGGPGSLLRTWSYLVSHRDQTNLVTLAMASVSISLLLCCDLLLAPRLKQHCRFPFPGQLLLLLAATSLSTLLGLGSRNGVKTVGDIGNLDNSLPAPSFAHLASLPDIILPSIPIAIVSIVIGHGLGSHFGAKHGYSVPANPECLAQGISNLVGSLFSCLPMAGSLSRSAVQEAAGCKSQLTSLVSATSLLLLLLTRLGPLLQPLPLCVLAAIILASLVGVLGKLRDCYKFWQRSAWDGAVWLVTLLVTVLLSVEWGLLVGLATSLAATLTQAATPRLVVLGPGPDPAVWLDRKQYQTGSGAGLVLQLTGPVTFLSVWLLRRTIQCEVGTEPGLWRGGGRGSCKASRGRVAPVPGEGVGLLARPVVVDLAGVTVLDQTGCGLVAWLDRALAAPALVAPPHTEQLLERAGLELERLQGRLYPSLQDATALHCS